MDTLTPRCAAALYQMRANPTLILRPTGANTYALEPARLSGPIMYADEVRAMLKAGVLDYDSKAQGYRAAGSAGAGEAITAWRRK